MLVVLLMLGHQNLYRYLVIGFCITTDWYLQLCFMRGIHIDGLIRIIQDETQLGDLICVSIPQTIRGYMNYGDKGPNPYDRWMLRMNQVSMLCYRD